MSSTQQEEHKQVHAELKAVVKSIVALAAKLISLDNYADLGQVLNNLKATLYNVGTELSLGDGDNVSFESEDDDDGNVGTELSLGDDNE